MLMIAGELIGYAAGSFALTALPAARLVGILASYFASLAFS